MPATYDCEHCGACCTNALENERRGERAYVPVERGAKLLARKDLVKKLVVLDDAGEPHLRLDPDGRCLALRGRLFERVSCGIYAIRPKACRTVQPGDGDCERARRERLAAPPALARGRSGS